MQVCVRGFVWVCAGYVHIRGVCRIERMWASAWLCTGVRGCMQMYARVCSGVHRYARVYAGVRRYLQVCMENCGIHFYYINKYVCAGVQEQ